MKFKIRISTNVDGTKVSWEIETLEPVGVLTAKQQEELFVQMQRMRQIVTKECERLKKEHQNKEIRKGYAKRFKHGKVYSDEKGDTTT